MILSSHCIPDSPPGGSSNAPSIGHRFDTSQQSLQWPLKNILAGIRNSLHFPLKLCGRLNLAWDVRFTRYPSVATP